MVFGYLFAVSPDSSDLRSRQAATPTIWVAPLYYYYDLFPVIPMVCVSVMRIRFPAGAPARYRSPPPISAVLFLYYCFCAGPHRMDVPRSRRLPLGGRCALRGILFVWYVRPLSPNYGVTCFHIWHLIRMCTSGPAFRWEPPSRLWPSICTPLTGRPPYFYNDPPSVRHLLGYPPTSNPRGIDS